jgi:hypothetical protein
VATAGLHPGRGGAGGEAVQADFGLKVVGCGLRVVGCEVVRL